MNTPRFSVTIPAYKHKFLKECIDSILSQTYMDFELIIVNDASPEDIGTVVSAYRDPRIRYYINEKNCGAINVVDNWNKCLEYAKGKYIICMGDDDKLMPNCLEEYSRLIVRYPDLDAFHGRVARITDDSKIIDTPGFSNLKFDFLMPNEVDTLFSEIHPYKVNCKFPDCLHIHETGCAVKANIGKIDETRYESYISFVEEAKSYKEKVKKQGTKKETARKSIHKKVTAKISSKNRESSRNTTKQNIYKDLNNADFD